MKFIGFAKSVAGIWKLPDSGRNQPEVLRPYCGFDIIDYFILVISSRFQSVLFWKRRTETETWKIVIYEKAFSIHHFVILAFAFAQNEQRVLLW
jgi:hypothetical protein